jgi:hypothetical protein
MMCCEDMEWHLSQECRVHPDPWDCGDAVLGQFSDGTVGLIIHDGGRSLIEIGYCPFCGSEISKRAGGRRIDPA